MNDSSFKVGITKTWPCSYLPDEEERLLIAVDERLQNKHSYSILMTEGFRRSGEQSYRPYCPHCHACQSIRVLVNDYFSSVRDILSDNISVAILASSIIL